MLAMMAIVLDIVSLVGAYVIISMPLTMGLVLGGIIVGSVGFFGCLAYIGFCLQNQLENLVRENAPWLPKGGRRDFVSHKPMKTTKNETILGSGLKSFFEWSFTRQYGRTGYD